MGNLSLKKSIHPKGRDEQITFQETNEWISHKKETYFLTPQEEKWDKRRMSYNENLGEWQKSPSHNLNNRENLIDKGIMRKGPYWQLSPFSFFPK